LDKSDEKFEECGGFHHIQSIDSGIDSPPQWTSSQARQLRTLPAPKLFTFVEDPHVSKSASPVPVYRAQLSPPTAFNSSLMTPVLLDPPSPALVPTLMNTVVSCTGAALTPTVPLVVAPAVRAMTAPKMEATPSMGTSPSAASDLARTAPALSLENKAASAAFLSAVLATTSPTTVDIDLLAAPEQQQQKQAPASPSVTPPAAPLSEPQVPPASDLSALMGGYTPPRRPVRRASSDQLLSAHRNRDLFAPTRVEVPVASPTSLLSSPKNDKPPLPRAGSRGGAGSSRSLLSPTSTAPMASVVSPSASSASPNVVVAPITAGAQLVLPQLLTAGSTRGAFGGSGTQLLVVMEETSGAGASPTSTPRPQGPDADKTAATSTAPLDRARSSGNVSGSPQQGIKTPPQSAFSRSLLSLSSMQDHVWQSVLFYGGGVPRLNIMFQFSLPPICSILSSV
jgi:hypothetical protein